MTTVDAARAWAHGTYPIEAGVELLARAGMLERTGAVEPSGAVDVDQLVQDSGPWSAGEKQVVRIAASLLAGLPVDLSEELTGLDRKVLGLVLAAVAHAGGSHEHSGFTFDDDGRPTAITELQPLHPWPEQVSA